jgi:hypothetical protein
MHALATAFATAFTTVIALLRLPRLPRLPGKTALSHELFQRLALGAVFIAIGQNLATDYIAHYATSEPLRHGMLLLFSVLWLILLRNWGKGDLVRDMLDLAFYDSLIQLFGLAMACLHQAPDAWQAFNSAILFAKVVRLLWPGTTDDGSAFAGWPVFGPHGYVSQGMLKADPRKALPTTRHDRCAYAALVVALLLGGLAAFSMPTHIDWRWLDLPLAGIVWFGKVMVDQLLDDEQRQADLQRMEWARQDAIELYDACEDLIYDQIEFTDHFSPEVLTLIDKITRLTPEVQDVLTDITDGATDDQMLADYESSPEGRRAAMHVVN